MKKQNGITLIALIITIIVMLILVGVSVTVALNGGLFSTAKQATSQTQLELDKEQLLMAAIGAIGSNGKVDTTKLEPPEGFTESEGIYTSKAGNKFTISENGSVLLATENEGDPDEPTDTPTEYTAYSIGDVVTIGTETFYVIEASDSSNPNVTLLAKDCIDVANLVQSASANKVSFSTEKYWEDNAEIVEPEPTLDEETGKLTLPASHIAAKAAYDYGAKVGGTGRLMTKSEAEALQTANSDILYGTNGKSSSTYLNYWLGSAWSTYDVWDVYGGSGLGHRSFDYGGHYGVRPVVIVLKSNI